VSAKRNKERDVNENLLLLRKGDDRQYYGQKERKQVFINVKIVTYLRSLMENLAYALILSGIWCVEQYIVNVLANEQYIGRVSEVSSTRANNILVTEKQQYILHCNIQCRQDVEFPAKIYILYCIQ
jgi:hypothetical protein